MPQNKHQSPLLSDVAAWRSALGMLPVPLREFSTDERFVLLNGASGNFCLDFTSAYSRDERRSIAWSCDVGHYVSVTSDQVTVDRWDRGTGEERYSVASVLEKVHEFQRHLEKSTIDNTQNILSHSLRIFRQIRTIVNDEASGRHSLQMFLYLLASSASGGSFDAQHSGAFGISNSAATDFGNLGQASREALYRDLIGEGRYDVLKPDIALTLRHASGALFQEAHLRAQLSPNMYLPGLEVGSLVAADGVSIEQGIFFTPQALARTLAEEAVLEIGNFQARTHLTLFDPACGSGELLKEVLRQLKGKNFTGNIKVIGWDKSGISADMARFSLSWELRSWKPNQVTLEVTEIDSVESERWPSNVDVLVMNPPFQSWQSMSKAEQDAATARLGGLLRNKPNLASVFAVRALDTLNPDGVLAMVGPRSLFEGDSASKVRNLLLEKLVPKLLAKLGDQNIFSRALVDAGLFVGVASTKIPNRMAILWSDSQPHSLSKGLRGLRRWRGAESTPLVEEEFSVYLRPTTVAPSGAPWIARSFDSWMAYENVRGSKRVASADQLFDIRQGARLGSDCFIVTEGYLNKLPTAEKMFFRPAVMNSSIANLRLNRDYYVFYPYTEGLLPIGSENELLGAVPTYFNEVLLHEKKRLTSRKSMTPNWWDLIRHRSWQMEQTPHLVSKYFGDTNSYAFDESGEFVVVVGHAWIPSETLVRHAASAREISLAMLCYLQSKTAQALLRYVSVQISGGQWDLSAKYLSKLLIPDFNKINNSQLEMMVQVGEQLVQTGRTLDINIDSLVQAVIHGK